MQHSRSQGFTLVELLIVIAIILILIAIALPNFLAARQRSMVTRSLSDMRSQMVAVESYRLDWGSYPYPSGVLLNGTIVPVMPTPVHADYQHNYLPTSLTTPTAYLTAIHNDLFFRIDPADDRVMNYYYYMSFEYTEELLKAAGMDWMPPMLARRRAYGEWIMTSAGPDGDRKDISPQAAGALTPYMGEYTPTNGLQSNGDLVLTQKVGLGMKRG